MKVYATGKNILIKQLERTDNKTPLIEYPPGYFESVFGEVISVGIDVKSIKEKDLVVFSTSISINLGDIDDRFKQMYLSSEDDIFLRVEDIDE